MSASASQLDASVVEAVVADVLKQMITSAPGSAAPGSAVSAAPAVAGNSDGVFTDVNAAVATAKAAQQQLDQAGIDVRDGICQRIKQIAGENAEPWGQFEFNESKLGRLDHKIAKLALIQSVPGVEFLKAHGTVAHSGKDGVGLDEAAAWGVIGVITPVTHSIPTMTANAVSMIASGNSMVVNPHPSASKSAALAARAYNNMIRDEFGLGPLVCVIEPPTLESADAIFKHPDVSMLVVTGGPAVARAAMSLPKRAVVAGPGNPPVVVDETANLKVAAESIVAGAAFDNNLLCIGEKEVFAVDSIFNKLMAEMTYAGGMWLSTEQVNALTKMAFKWKDDHWVVNKDFVGASPQTLGQRAGFEVPAGIELLFGETAADNPYVPTEQMMPFVPFVRCPDFETAMALAIENEHGYGHTAVIHSHNLDRITQMGKAVNTTIFVANGPSTAGLGIGGEGYPSFSIATPTGEGITTPLTFTRFRRMTVAGALRMV